MAALVIIFLFMTFTTQNTIADFLLSVRVPWKSNLWVCPVGVNAVCCLSSEVGVGVAPVTVDLWHTPPLASQVQGTLRRVCEMLWRWCCSNHTGSEFFHLWCHVHYDLTVASGGQSKLNGHQQDGGCVPAPPLPGFQIYIHPYSRHD